MKLANIILPSASPPPSGPPKTYDIDISEHRITGISPSATDPTAAPPSLLLPTLCHPHIHLDKAYLLTSHQQPDCPDHPDYSDLAPETGSFPEALSNTAAAKSRFTPADLLLRGRQLLATSYTQGVTSARCFVEIDHVTRFKCLDAALQLKPEFEDPSSPLVRVQLCAFAQDPVFSTEHGEENRRVMEAALARHANPADHGPDASSPNGGDGRGIEVLGSTPYVETSRAARLQNIDWAITTALKHDLHLDFHLDYNLDETQSPGDLLIWHVIRQLQTRNWPTTAHGKPPRTVAIGHSTALTLLPHADLERLAATIHAADLPLSFVGLPTSDTYMMGRPSSPSSSPANRPPLHRPLGTLNPLILSQKYNLRACLSVNNVGNAFTPYGTGDPLETASWGVGLYHGGTRRDAVGLYGAVSWLARDAIGLSSSLSSGRSATPSQSGPDGPGSRPKDNDEQDITGLDGVNLEPGQSIGAFGLLHVRNEASISTGSSGMLLPTGAMIPARQRWDVRDVVWDVPRVELRRVVR